ncbi:MAG: hypothetical protein KBT13_06845, partial [Bacteroidales bacterium]|nr:hypothetical protein [Candidatus Sodaliphilus limicaballi]
DKDHMLHTLMGKKNTLILAGAMLCAAFCNAQEVEQVDSVLSADLDEVVVTSAGSTRRLGGAVNGIEKEATPCTSAKESCQGQQGSCCGGGQSSCCGK